MLRTLFLCLVTVSSISVFAQKNPLSKTIKDLEKASRSIPASKQKSPKATIPDEAGTVITGGDLTQPTPERDLHVVDLKLNDDRKAYPWYIGDNLLLDIDMKAYDNYAPEWRNITTFNKISFTVNNSQRDARPGKDEGMMSLFHYQNRAYVHIQGLRAVPCDCIMPVITPVGKAVIIGEQKQTFALGPCKMVTGGRTGQLRVTDEPCTSAFASSKSYEGRLTLWAAKDGTLGFEMEVQTYTAGTSRKASEPSNHYTTGSKTVPNKRPPSKYVYALIAQQPETQHLTQLFQFFMEQIMIEPLWFSPRNLPATLKIDNVKKDKAGTITEATASFLTSRRHASGSDSARHQLMIRFDQGIPYRIYYPADDIMDHSIRTRYIKDSLSFTKQQTQRIAQLNKEMDDRNATVFEANRKRSLDSVLRKQAAYKGTTCNDCLVKRVECYRIPYIEVTERIGEAPEIVEKYHLVCDAYLKNKSDKPIRVIGIGKKYDYHRGYYYTDVSYLLKPGQERLYSSGSGIGIDGSGEYPVYMSGQYDEAKVESTMSQWFKVVYQQ